jgi:hypothetical protein
MAIKYLFIDIIIVDRLDGREKRKERILWPGVFFTYGPKGSGPA